ncbi:MAG: SDR family NAD(P)-dependent oxidoreductase [Gemmataceae bacterium]|nr:SDR family NAD(P)-dependent oxidoreductase [Gemmataceae bacterium]
MRKLSEDYKTALVTGAGSGLGRQLAQDLMSEGVAVAGLDRRPEGLQSLAAEAKGVFGWAEADVTDPAHMAAGVSDLERRLGPIDLVIACAGIGHETSVVTKERGDVPGIVQVNLIGVWNSINAVVTGMIERKKGHVVAISSLASYRGMPRMFGYCASKAGVNALMDGLRVELASFGVHATTICPGYIRTPMVEKNPMPMPGLMEVHQASETILWAIRKKKKFYAFPRRLAWRLRILRMLPRWWQDAVVRKWTKA